MLIQLCLDTAIEMQIVDNIEQLYQITNCGVAMIINAYLFYFLCQTPQIELLTIKIKVMKY